MKQFKVKQAFGNYTKGDLVSPTGLYRDYLQSYDYIEKHPYIAAEEAAHIEAETVTVFLSDEPIAPVPPCDDDDIQDDIDDGEDDLPLIETAEAPHGEVAVMAKRGRGRPRRV